MASVVVVSARCGRRHRRDELLQNSSRQLDVILGKLQSAPGIDLVEALGHQPTQVLVHRSAGQSRVDTRCGTDKRVMSCWQRWHRAFWQTDTMTGRCIMACIPVARKHTVILSSFMVKAWAEETFLKFIIYKKNVGEQFQLYQ